MKTPKISQSILKVWVQTSDNFTVGFSFKHSQSNWENCDMGGATDTHTDGWLISYPEKNHFSDKSKNENV